MMSGSNIELTVESCSWRQITSAKKTLHNCTYRGRFIAFARRFEAAQHLYRAKAMTFCRRTLYGTDLPPAIHLLKALV